jgi:hypothetical protein
VFGGLPELIRAEPIILLYKIRRMNMRVSLLAGAVALGLIVTDPAICAQIASPPPDGSQPVAGETEGPVPMPDPSNPTPPITEPLPPEMPVQQAPVVIDRSLPPGPPATPPTTAADAAVSGSTTTQMMTPVAATKDYPLCSKTLQDNCINPGEVPRAAKKRR